MNRRRSLSIVAGASAACLAGSGCQGVRQVEVSRWRGVLFNSDVDMAVHDLPASEAEAAPVPTVCVALPTVDPASSQALSSLRFFSAAANSSRAK